MLREDSMKKMDVKNIPTCSGHHQMRRWEGPWEVQTESNYREVGPKDQVYI